MKRSEENICSTSGPPSTAEEARGYLPSGSVAKQPHKRKYINIHII
jgi:hypothetical protein